MATTFKWTALGTLTSYLGAELNALANAGNVIGAAIDNTANLNTYMAVELFVNTQGVARSAGAYVSLYLLPSVDGTNYAYGGAALTPSAQRLVGVFALDAAVTARYTVLVDLPIPPTKFMLLVQNNTGQAFAATLSTLKYRVYDMQGV